MAYIAVGLYGEEVVCRIPPVRNATYWELNDYYEDGVVLPNGSVEKLIGRKLTWADEPVKLDGYE
jgi:hypothetical protein